MNKALIVLLALTLLAGCAGQPRQGGPAPVENALKPRSQTAPPQAPAVDVYAYRAPNTTPPPAPVPVAAEYGQEPLTPPVAEGPGTSGGRGSSTLSPDIDPGLASAITWTPPASTASAQRATPAPASPAVQTPTRTQTQTQTQTQGKPATQTQTLSQTPTQAPPQAQTSGPWSLASSPPAQSGSPSPAQGPSAGRNSPATPTTGLASAGAPTSLASLAPTAAPKPPPPPPPEVRYTAPPPPAPDLPAAAASLASQAEKQRERGDYVAAAATLERAIRIQPREAYLWNRLARVRLDQKNYTQANSLAQKSNALSKDQVQIKEDNWGMIAATRRATGDAKGAEDAEAKAGGR